MRRIFCSRYTTFSVHKVASWLKARSDNQCWGSIKAEACTQANPRLISSKVDTGITFGVKCTCAAQKGDT